MELVKAFSLAVSIILFASDSAMAQVKIAVPVLSGHFDQNAYGRSAGALEAIYARCNLRPNFVTHRWGQHWQAFEDDASFDAVAIVWDSAEVSGFASDDFIRQRNGVAFLASKKLQIKTVADLKGLRVLGFGGATELFPDLAEVLPTLGRYWEAPPGFASRLALVNNDVDVFITDGLIFAIDYIDQVNLNGAHYGDENWPAMKFVGLFPEIGDKMHFRREADRDTFNRCLHEARASGSIAEATKKYVDPYRMIVGDSVPKD
ncbi:MAG: ABC transporter substrate-binding protein [Alphaproteobacteria bacterium]|nr:ABC transporter substrate-binding protein [Alphaproteobacteria bacterium]